jgi:transposase
MASVLKDQPIKGKPRGRTFLYERPPDGVLKRRYETEGKTTAEIGALFGVSYSTALRWLHEANVTMRAGGKYTHRHPNRPSPMRLRDLYHHEKASHPEIATRFGASSSSVGDWCREAGLQARPRSERLSMALSKKPKSETPSKAALASAERLRRWRENAPPEYRETLRRNAKRATAVYAYRHRARPSPCCWCGEPCLRLPWRVKLRGACCNNSHAGLFGNWTRHHPDEPRPLILDRLRQGADWNDVGALQAEIDAFRAEIHAMRGENQQPIIPRPLPVQSPPPPQPKKKRALTEEQIGPLGEALLRAQREAR